jgi:hypothetical protein
MPQTWGQQNVNRENADTVDMWSLIVQFRMMVELQQSPMSLHVIGIVFIGLQDAKRPSKKPLALSSSVPFLLAAVGLAWVLVIAWCQSDLIHCTTLTLWIWQNISAVKKIWYQIDLCLLPHDDTNFPVKLTNIYLRLLGVKNPMFLNKKQSRLCSFLHERKLMISFSNCHLNAVSPELISQSLYHQMVSSDGYLNSRSVESAIPGSEIPITNTLKSISKAKKFNSISSGESWMVLTSQFFLIQLTLRPAKTSSHQSAWQLDTT